VPPGVGENDCARVRSSDTAKSGKTGVDFRVCRNLVKQSDPFYFDPRLILNGQHSNTLYHHSSSVNEEARHARRSSARSEYTTARSESGSEIVVPGVSCSDRRIERRRKRTPGYEAIKANRTRRGRSGVPEYGDVHVTGSCSSAARYELFGVSFRWWEDLWKKPS
jgi:hypothetical protein